jgi:hypothetical protein
MFNLILIAHITVATIMTVAVLGVVAAAHGKRETKAYAAMLGSFGLTVASGIGLLFVAAGGLGRFCVMMSAFTLSVIAARAYYRARVTSQTSL